MSFVNIYKETDIMICRYEAVESIGKESARIKFKKLPATKALSLFYKGAYDEIGEAYSFLMKCVEDNDYHILMVFGIKNRLMNGSQKFNFQLFRRLEK